MKQDCWHPAKHTKELLSPLDLRNSFLRKILPPRRKHKNFLPRRSRPLASSLFIISLLIAILFSIIITSSIIKSLSCVKMPFAIIAFPPVVETRLITRTTIRKIRFEMFKSFARRWGRIGIVLFIRPIEWGWIGKTFREIVIGVSI